MTTIRLGRGLAAALLAAACAGGQQQTKPQGQAHAEILGETPAAGAAGQAGQDQGQAAAPQAQPGAQQPGAAPQQAASADPFANCRAKLAKQGVAVLECGAVLGVLARVNRKLDQNAVEQNFAAFRKEFPDDAQSERYSRDIAGATGSGLRIWDKTGEPFRAAIVVLPLAPKQTRVISCLVRGSTDWTRCEKVVGTLGEQGVPSNLPGADQLPDSLKQAAPPPQQQKNASASGT
jgi:hypothetical protein